MPPANFAGGFFYRDPAEKRIPLASRRAPDRMSSAERRSLYARTLGRHGGAAGGDAANESNREFQWAMAILLATLCLALPISWRAGRAIVQPITYLIPLRYFLVILRSIFLKGVGLETLWPQALALAAWGVGILALAITRSSKRVS